MLEGEVEVVDDSGELRRWVVEIAGRYMGAERAEEFSARNAVPGELLLRLRPGRAVGAGNVSDQ